MQKHKWHKEIIAWANGEKIEYRAQDFPGEWSWATYIDWDNPALEFRIYSPYQEWIDAQTRGEKLQWTGWSTITDSWQNVDFRVSDYRASLSTDGIKFRIKPKEDIVAENVQLSFSYLSPKIGFRWRKEVSNIKVTLDPDTYAIKSVEVLK